MKKKVLILGSSVSRDVFNYDKDNKYEIVEYFARSSLISLYSGSTPFKNIEFIEQLSSSFQKRIVGYDLQKKFVENLGQMKFDILLIDFIDERFDIFEFEDGSKCTISSELVNTGFLTLFKGRKIISGSQEHFSLWQEAWDSFVEHLKILNVFDKVVVQKAYWANNDCNYEYSNYSHDKIDLANKYLKQMYSYVSKDLVENKLISSSNLIATTQHRWGCAPFHYIDSYYEDILKFLNKIDVQKIFIQNVYDPYALHYKVYNHKSSHTDNVESFLYNGIHRICEHESNSIDFLIDGLENLQNSEYILVCLSGAVSNRSGLRAPFFSGIGFSKHLRNTLISISDPTLALDDIISIGWYTGNHFIGNFPRKVASFLDDISSRLNKKLLFFGGSGGGYASLLISSFVKTKSLALIWNPQTAIIDHNPGRFVKEFEKIALRENETIETTSLITDIRNLTVSKSTKVLYLQNITDYHHCEKQLFPYMKDKNYNLIGNSTFINDESNVVISLGNFGEGHAVPSYNLLLFLVSHLMRKESVIHTAWLLDSGIDKLHKPLKKIIALHLYKDFPFKVKIQRQNNQLSLECQFEDVSIDNSQFRFAYYLLSKNVRIDMIWYSHNNACLFVLPQDTKNLSVLCFVKDVFGTLKTSNIKIDI